MCIFGQHHSMIAIIDYGAGNLGSIGNMLKKLGIPAVITADATVIAGADKLILPGVGAFDYGMQKLHASGLIPVITEKTQQQQTPFLGICLGMQLMTRRSEEGELPGLGWFAADTRRFDDTRLNPGEKIPHMSWAEVSCPRKHPLTENLGELPRYYFVHAYHVVCDGPGDAILTARYGYDFVAAFAHDHIMGVQFHPEKSHRFGMQLLHNFSRL
jgi:imidazole glycerol-phosphate synthase subunit HisH